MPDLKDIKNPVIGKDSRSLVVRFSKLISSSPPTSGSVDVPFEDLSDGEKCFMICALALAASDAYSQLPCFWDEPDSHLAPSEGGHLCWLFVKGFNPVVSSS